MLQPYNPLEELLKRLSSGGLQRSPTQPYMAAGGLMPPSQDATDLMNPSPKDVQFDQFVNLINSLPQRNQYEPSKFRRIAAGIAGMGTGGPAAYSNGAALGFKSDIPSGLKVQRSILDEPYEKALTDWEIKAKPTLESAKLENTKNVNERVGLSNVRSAAIRDKTLTRQIDRDRELAREADIKADQGQQKIDISKQNADTLKYKADHPNKTFKDANGKLVALDPVDGSAEIVKDSDGNEIDTGKLDDKTKLDIQLQNRLTSIKAQGSETRKTEDVRQGNRLEMETERQANRKENIVLRNVVKPKNETPSQRKVRLYNNASEALNKHPDWAPYIKLSPGNNFRIIIPAGQTSWLNWRKSTGAGDAKTAEAINDFIYGDSDTADKSEIETSGAKTVETAKNTKIPDSEARIMITDGNKNFTLPSSQVDAYIKLHPEFKRGKK